MRKLFLVFLLLLASSTLSVLYVYRYFWSQGPLQNPVSVVIKTGTSVREISCILFENNVIEQPELFYLIANIKRLKTRSVIKAGEYGFSALTSPEDVLNKMIKGDVLVHSVTIPEGFTVTQIVNIINNIPILTGEIPKNILENLEEGALLPDTYHYLYGNDRGELIARMRVARDSFLESIWKTYIPLNGIIHTKQEAVILASIVEKETGQDDERGLIASVFINRLKIGMRLQTDPSVIYAITGGKYIFDRPLNRQDLEINSPYNTYLYAGLPPHPIANPGKKSIEAVLNPPKTNFLYFVADGTGGHKFASTLSEHNNNVSSWRKLNREHNND